MRLLQALALCGAPLVLYTGCVSQGELLGPPFEVVVLDRVPGPADVAQSEDSGFALRQRELTTVEDFDQLSAAAFRIRQGGTLTAEIVNGDTVSSGSFEGGEAPDLRYVVQGATAVPRDYATLLMFSAAYQFEQVSSGLRAATDERIRAALDAQGPLDVMFGPALVARVEGVRAALRMRTNAFFFPAGWQFGLALSSPIERAPLAADRRVIAHELGHAVFQLAFYGGETTACDEDAASEHAGDAWFAGRLEAELALGGLNEGFADWISFAVTGGTDPLESIAVPADAALDENVAARVLTEDTFRWSNIVDGDADQQSDRRCAGKYCIGTLFARSLVATYRGAGHELEDERARHEFSGELVEALEGAEAAMRRGNLPLPSQEVASCKNRDQVSSSADAPIVGAFLQAFLQGLPGDTRGRLCIELVDRFEAGFPVEFREECQP
ncbi:MAG TPA: hypothetical protein VFS67_14980 [Polyangiaceae bacterium]|jgi:hypothetical protein|nr:hypothetical protein [Polyangiaceae bacterium]